ncbi:3-dehydroquinate synthase [Oceanirhabdus sp. W0125-5]|uniref:3-dehydroquinate synthase n=1 Tax=Oceanirhabdus sp. W0125-5 TaxID=2999116 RepID=UPI0022F2C752|nr:3-dehydroquinate synthase [Oceanirhabdus sp. W0125-5]WBW99349.1 3-dehydroquinate synthase [Oceanirhabdus sp. W0125-5]
MDKINFILKGEERNITISFSNMNEIEEIIYTCGYKGICIITDENVYTHYSSCIDNLLKKISGSLMILEPGEKSKSMKTLGDIYSELDLRGIKRDDLIIAFGGGVIGDLTGFAASTYLRGIDLMQVPTTVLSQVDSSVGGKTAINIGNHKNRVGSFYQPHNVLVNIDFLNTLDKREFNNGCAEIIKYGCILDKELFNIIYESAALHDIRETEKCKLEEIIRRCIELKIDVVQKDEKDIGIRNILNFGHTLGHVIEGVEGYQKYKHGEAVAIGMYIITKWSERKGYTEKGTTDKIKRILLKNNLPICVNGVNSEFVYNSITKDKKASSSGVKLILLNEIGECFIKNVSLEDLSIMIEEIFN